MVVHLSLLRMMGGWVTCVRVVDVVVVDGLGRAMVDRSQMSFYFLCISVRVCSVRSMTKAHPMVLDDELAWLSIALCVAWHKGIVSMAIQVISQATMNL